MLLVLLVTTGCGEEKELIEGVKNSPLNNTFTFSQSFESTPYCVGSKWLLENDQYNRNVVVHKCTIHISRAAIERYRDEHKYTESDARFSTGEKAANLPYQLEQTNNMKETAKIYEKYIKQIEETCPSPEVNLNDVDPTQLRLCNEHKQNNFRHNFAVNNFIKRWGGGDIWESIKIAEEAFITDKKLIEQDELEIARLIDEANKEFYNQFPKEINVERVIKITVLPNDKLSWTDPVFITPEKKYQAGGFDITTRQLVGMGLSTEFDAEQYLLDRLYGRDKGRAFKKFVEAQCSEDGCPLNFMN